MCRIIYFLRRPREQIVKYIINFEESGLAPLLCPSGQGGGLELTILLAASTVERRAGSNPAGSVLLHVSHVSCDQNVRLVVQFKNFAQPII